MIKIVERFTPFSHIPGTSALIPNSPFVVTAYPTKLVISSEKERYEVGLDIVGPVTGFTLQQDLEKKEVLLFGRGKEGYFHCTISHVGKEIKLRFLRKGEQSISVGESPFEEKNIERLSLGVHKKLDWEMVLRRKDPLEMLPPLFFLGQMIPNFGEEKGQRLEKLEDFSTLLEAGFEGILVPKRMDTLFLGLNWGGIPHHLPTLSSLRESYEAIRSFFVKEGEKIHLFPNLPHQFFCGRLVGLSLKNALADIEWTKGKLRRMTLFPKSSEPFSFQFPKELTSFRIRTNLTEKGTWVSTKEKLPLVAGERYFLDKFQK